MYATATETVGAMFDGVPVSLDLVFAVEDGATVGVLTGARDFGCRLPDWQGAGMAGGALFARRKLPALGFTSAAGVAHFGSLFLAAGRAGARRLARLRRAR